MPNIPHMSPEQFRALGHRFVDWIADYHDRIESLPVRSGALPGDIAAQLPVVPPERPLGNWDAVFDDLERVILPGLTHWQSPNFHAYFPCNASFPGILGELLSAGLNVNGMLWATSPAATELETRVLDWMGLMLGLPERFLSTSRAGGGCIQGTASESTLVAMLAARRRRSGHHPTLYASAQAHSSVVKAAMIAGLASGPEDRAHVRMVPTDADHAMRVDALEAAIRDDLAAGRTPVYVCATVGTTGSTAVDPVRRIGEVLRRLCPGAWLHVDAAHSGAACICPEHRWMLEGVGLADSICFNPHKQLLANFDCDCFWTTDRRALIDALSITPEYLRNAASESGSVIDYRDWQVPLGRRFRALKLWFVIRHYGAEGLRAYVRDRVGLAELFESLVRADPRFELAAPRTFNLVCFRLRGDDGLNRALLEAINASGRACLSHAVLADRFVLRFCPGATHAQERHVREAWALIRSLV